MYKRQDYGRQCRDLIHGVLERYITFFNGGHAAVSWDDAREISKQFLPFLQRYSPELLDELEGIAEGSGASFDDLLTLNSRSEAMTLIKRPASDEEELDGCSSVAVLPEAMGDGHTLLAQNWDTYSWQEYGTIILQVLRDDGPDLMLVTEAGQLARYGMNQAGIALGVNSLHKTFNTKVFGLSLIHIYLLVAQVNEAHPLGQHRLGSNEKNVDGLFGEHLLQGQAVALYELDLYPWILRFERG